jgi:hypothetical protein
MVIDEQAYPTEHKILQRKYLMPALLAEVER